MEKRRLSHRWSLAIGLLIAAVAVALALPALAAGHVTVDVSVTGRMFPNGTVLATAHVTGATAQSYRWTQTGGTEAKLTGTSSQTLTAKLGPRWKYRNYLRHVLAEPPIGEDQLPPNIPPPEGEFPGGLQDRFEVLGLNPFSIEEAGLVTFEVRVMTNEGPFIGHAEIETHLPWQPTAGVRTVPVGVPVLLNGKEQSSYDWTLSGPGSASLMGANVVNPEFTPNAPGLYTLEVTDRATMTPVEIEVFAGTWRGVIVGQDADGRPVSDGACTGCHSGFAPDKFTPWAQTGHAEILTDNLNTSTHYGPNCFPCHAVGYDPGSTNGGFDEASDYQDFLDSGLLNNPGDNWTVMLEDYPEAAQLANIQCENCHGPQNDNGAHGPSMPDGEPRTDISSDVCATCHGEPLRHARFQQWQLSGHANYELAIDEGDSGNCSRCHTGNGFLEWLPILLGDEPGDPTASIPVTWEVDDVHPQTCVICHDPHAIGTTTGADTNATVRISGNTPELIAGFTATGVGRGAICMTCHNSRRGIRNDATWDEFKDTSDSVRAPHGSSQTDLLFGENAYMMNVGVRGGHSFVQDTCVTCHMVNTPPPDDLAYNSGGTNHTFFAAPDICGDCHEGVNVSNLQIAVQAVMDHVQGVIEATYLDVLGDILDSGKSIDFNGTVVTSSGQLQGVLFGEARGRQALEITMTSGTVLELMRITDIDVIDGGGSVALWEVLDDALMQAGWNWNLVHNDGSKGVHNPTFALAVLDAARDALGATGGPRARFELP